MKRTSRFSSTARHLALPAAVFVTAFAVALGTPTALAGQHPAGAEDEIPTAQSAHRPPLVLQAQGSFFVGGHRKATAAVNSLVPGPDTIPVDQNGRPERSTRTVDQT
jgi:hypothetical protein